MFTNLKGSDMYQDISRRVPQKYQSLPVINRFQVEYRDIPGGDDDSPNEKDLFFWIRGYIPDSVSDVTDKNDQAIVVITPRSLTYNEKRKNKKFDGNFQVSTGSLYGIFISNEGIIRENALLRLVEIVYMDERRIYQKPIGYISQETEKEEFPVMDQWVKDFRTPLTNQIKESVCGEYARLNPVLSDWSCDDDRDILFRLTSHSQSQDALVLSKTECTLSFMRDNFFMKGLEEKKIPIDQIVGMCLAHYVMYEDDYTDVILQLENGSKVYVGSIKANWRPDCSKSRIVEIFNSLVGTYRKERKELQMEEVMPRAENLKWEECKDINSNTFYVADMGDRGDWNVNPMYKDDKIVWYIEAGGNIEECIEKIRDEDEKGFYRRHYSTSEEAKRAVEEWEYKNKEDSQKSIPDKLTLSYFGGIAEKDKVDAAIDHALSKFRIAKIHGNENTGISRDHMETLLTYIKDLETANKGLAGKPSVDLEYKNLNPDLSGFTKDARLEAVNGAVSRFLYEINQQRVQGSQKAEMRSEDAVLLLTHIKNLRNWNVNLEEDVKKMENLLALRASISSRMEGMLRKTHDDIQAIVEEVGEFLEPFDGDGKEEADEDSKK